MTDPLTIGRGELLLARQTGGADKPAFDPVLKVTIPKEGKRFVLALFSSPKPTPAKPYEFRLVRTDGLRFGDFGSLSLQPDHPSHRRLVRQREILPRARRLQRRDAQTGQGRRPDVSKPLLLPDRWPDKTLQRHPLAARDVRPRLSILHSRPRAPIDRVSVLPGIRAVSVKINAFAGLTVRHSNSSTSMSERRRKRRDRGWLMVVSIQLNVNSSYLYRAAR